jgi:ABC-type Fe3+/spermidine/putrescine transport system ATPase subunit
MSLEVKDLLVVRGTFTLEANFSLERGRVLVLLGPSGCGKTTLLRAIAGLEAIQRGKITLDGARIDNLPTEKRHMGFVFQDLALFEQMCVRDNIGYSLMIRHENKKYIHEKVMLLAQRFKIEHLLNRYPSELSGGERQRVAFARALASEPSLILLDEPLSALDAPLRREMRRFIRLQLAEGHLTAIHVTHDVEEAVDLADEIIVMRDGRMIGHGTIEDLEKGPGSGWLARFMNLGLVLPVKNICPAGASGALEVETSAGTLMYMAPKINVNTRHLSKNKVSLYAPLNAIDIAGDLGTATIRARIVRHIRSASNVAKLVLMFPDVENYYFEFPLKNRDSNISPEGTDIGISINTSLCQLLPEDPLVFDNKANTSNSLQEPRRLR